MIYSKIIENEDLFKEAKAYLEEELKETENEIIKTKRELIRLKIKLHGIMLSNEGNLSDDVIRDILNLENEQKEKEETLKFHVQERESILEEQSDLAMLRKLGDKA